VPSNKELESAVLSVILDGRHRQAVHTARASITTPLAFHERNNRIVWIAICDLDDHGHAVDAGSVAELLSRQKFHDTITRLKRLEFGERASIPKFDDGYDDSTLAQLGGFAVVSDMAAAFAPAGSLPRNVLLLVDLYGKRVLITKLREIADKAELTTDGMPALLDVAGQAILEMGRGVNTSQLYTAKQVWDETAADLEKRANGAEDTGVKSGIVALDAKLTRFRDGGLYILAARPGAGKTSLALSIVSNVCAAGGGVLFFQLEIDRVDMAKKLISSLSAIDFRDIESGRLDPQSQTAVKQAGEQVAAYNLSIQDTSDLSITALRSAVKRRLLDKKDIRLIVVDYLQLLSVSKKDASEYDRVTEISRTLKVLARELRIPVLCLSQMSRDSEKGETPRKPRLADLRGSGSIEQDADSVLFLHRSGGEDQARAIDICVAKNRFGPTGEFAMTFHPATMMFSENGGGGERFEKMNSEPRPGEDLF